MLTDADIQKLTTVLTKSLATVFVTKEDLKILEKNLEAKLGEKFATKDDLMALEQRLEKRMDYRFEKLIDDLYDMLHINNQRIDTLETKHKDIEVRVKCTETQVEELTMYPTLVHNHSKRITTLEQKLNT